MSSFKLTEFMLQLTQEVQDKLQLVAVNKMELGGLLLSLSDEFKEAGATNDEFLKYCKNTFSLSKSQIYDLMKAHKFVQSYPVFKDTAAFNVLRLSKCKDQDIIDKAAEFAANGSLTNAVLMNLIDPEPTGKSEEQEAAEKQLDDKVNAALESLGTKEPEASKEQDPKKTVNSSDEELIQQNKELRGLITTLKEQIEKLTEEKEKSKYEKNLPTLPQFNSEHAYVVLGLAKEDSEKVTYIKKAYRELIKLGYGEGHEAFSKLTGAKDSLLAAIGK